MISQGVSGLADQVFLSFRSRSADKQRCLSRKTGVGFVAARTGDSGVARKTERRHRRISHAVRLALLAKK
jgi:hypothetical protein